MSNALAIAAVTATLKNLLQAITADGDLNDASVTILPLDKARGTNTANQLNLFLYQIQRNPAWVNSDMPRQVQPGETGIPPLPLNLWYLLTAFGKNDDSDNSAQAYGHHVLGRAMSILHDHPVLSAADIITATHTLLPASDLDRQIERIRITLQPLSVDEIYRLWTGFATPYRLSAAYEVAVTLIESTRTARAPLPVLTRGQNDKGIASQPDLTPPYPALTAIAPPNKQPSARLNDLVTLSGNNLDGTNAGVRFNHPLWTAPVEIAPEPGGTGTELKVRIPNSPSAWPAGFYTVDIFVQRPGDSHRRSTNQVTLPLAPNMTISIASSPAGNNVFAVTATVTSVPDIWPAQRAALLLGDQEILPGAHPAKTSSLTFGPADMTAGDYFARLRVDGVDSLLVDRSVTPPVFDPSQKVIVA